MLKQCFILSALLIVGNEVFCAGEKSFSFKPPFSKWEIAAAVAEGADEGLRALAKIPEAQAVVALCAAAFVWYKNSQGMRIADMPMHFVGSRLGKLGMFLAASYSAYRMRDWYMERAAQKKLDTLFFEGKLLPEGDLDKWYTMLRSFPRVLKLAKKQIKPEMMHNEIEGIRRKELTDAKAVDRLRIVSLIVGIHYFYGVYRYNSQNSIDSLYSNWIHDIQKFADSLRVQKKKDEWYKIGALARNELRRRMNTLIELNNKTSSTVKGAEVQEPTVADAPAITKDDREFLGLKDDDKARDIDIQYKKLALKYHPDKKGGSNVLFQKLNATYLEVKDQMSKAYILKKYIPPYIEKWELKDIETVTDLERKALEGMGVEVIVPPPSASSSSSSSSSAQQPSNALTALPMQHVDDE